MPRPIAESTKERFISTLKAVYPEAMSRNGIRKVTGVHPKTLEKLLNFYLNEGVIEKINVRGAVDVFRWRKK